MSSSAQRVQVLRRHLCDDSSSSASLTGDAGLRPSEIAGVQVAKTDEDMTVAELRQLQCQSEDRGFLLKNSLREKVEKEQPWKRAFRPPPQSNYQIDSLDIEGQIPEDLVGTYFANGGAKLGLERPNGDILLYGHWFDGDGMITKFRFEPGGKVHFQNRFIDSNRYLQQGSNVEGFQVRGAWTRKNGGSLFSNAFRQPGNAANTSVLYLNNKLYALCEGAHPLEIDSETLTTKRSEHFQGQLAQVEAFTAHYKTCPKTGDIFAYGYKFFPTGLSFYHIDTSGVMVNHKTYSLPFQYNIHDCGFTENYLVFFLGPYIISAAKSIQMLIGQTSFGTSFEWKPELGTKVLIVSRKTLEVMKDFTIEATSGFHFGNCFELNDKELFITFARFDNRPEFEEHTGHVLFADYRRIGLPSIWSMVLDIEKGKTIRSGPVSQYRGEFPNWHPSYTGFKNKHQYHGCATSNHDAWLSAIEKYNLNTQEAVVYRFPEGCYLTEPLFVPRKNSTEDDDGYLVGTSYDSNVHRSFFYIICAKEMKFLARINLRHHIPYSYHGLFHHSQ